MPLDVRKVCDLPTEFPDDIKGLCPCAFGAEPHEELAGFRKVGDLPHIRRHSREAECHSNFICSVMDPKPVTLEGVHVRLEPLSLDYLDKLCEVGFDPTIWRWGLTQIQTPEDMKNYISAALKSQDEGTAIPFVTIEKSSGRVIGSSRYGNIDRENRRLEIGWTWLAPAWQRTSINTEAKYLMLRHAFEDLGCMRVEFKTDSLNEQSRQALKRIDAKEEGVFRNHMIAHGGRIRHSVFFSIVDSEWPEVKANLEEKLAR